MAKRVKTAAPEPVLEPEDQLIEPTEAEKAELEAQEPEESPDSNGEKYVFFGYSALARKGLSKKGATAYIKKEQILGFLEAVKGKESYKTTSFPVDTYVSPITAWLKHLGLVKKIPGPGLHTVPDEAKVKAAWNEAIESTKI